ncbi:hypothetical protein BWD09_07015 [Neisseria dentiae]|uniref:Uncharacterized protein n=1 Tax=Neisseria dentiae TaxID=194197 RepID=A0A1X3D993_9NEIS|nr:hypothetical protein [Neisseria dentiae]OSI16509.1 hypothetical protein BWD09_07015 [Neisseria dentiae]QMT44235.1 hypothetical protein H3L92_06980 [Neisseria dentiae]STZ49908.1 Uncharacterised protein [Neisseria dentiae]STZ83156.1 Uncharacterised protein [Neisseria dentiae]
MKVALYPFFIARSIDTKIKVTVPKYEAEILLSVHGEDRVSIESDNVVGSFEVDSAAEERERLRMKYGMKNQDSFWVDDVFKRQQDFADALEKSKYIEESAEDGAYSKNTREELKAILDGMMVKYPANASKEQLISLVEANAPAV